MLKYIVSILIQFTFLINLFTQSNKVSNIARLTDILQDTSIKLEPEIIKGYEREYWFLSTRYDSLGGIDSYMNAVNRFYSNLKSTQNSDTKSLLTQEDIEWNYLGPKGLDFQGNLYNTNFGSIGRGWINSIKVLNTNTIYAGARNSGLWFTSNGGNSWENISESEPLINGILSILIDPEDPDHIIVLTKRKTAGDLAEYTNGIFETYDHGDSWDIIDVEVSGENIFPTAWDWEYPVKLVHKPDDFSYLLLITNSSVYRKRGAYNWERIFHGDVWGSWNTDIIFDKTNNNVFYLGGALVYKMTLTLHGVSSINITDDITGNNNDTIVRCMISIADNYPNKIWFNYRDRSGLTHLVKYENSTYSYMHAGIGGNYTMHITASENNDNIVYLGAVRIVKYNEISDNIDDIAYRLLGSNESAADVTDYLHADIRDMYVLDNGDDRLYVGHDGGVAWGEDGADSCGTNKFCWHQISDDGTDGLQTNEFYGISISNSDDLVIQGGTQDCSTFIYDESDDKWFHAYQADGLEGSVSLSDKNKVIAGGGGSSIFYQFYDLSDISSHFPILTTGGSFQTQVKLDPSDHNVLYIGGNDLYRITNCFTTSHSATLVSTPVNTRISGFTIACNNDAIIYVAETISSSGSCANHMWRYNPSTSSWIDISTNLSQYSNSFVTDIITNPLDDNKVWICMGQTTNQNNKVFYSSNGGTNWSALSSGYPAGIPANRLMYDHVSSKLYVATDVGIFKWDMYHPENGWEYLSETMPFKLVTDIERDYVNPRLIAGTYGRGIWEGILPEDECYDEDPLNISNSVYWNVPQTICQNVYVRNGGYLEISSEVHLSVAATITIENGGTVKINGGQLFNGNTKINSGGNFSIENNGSIKLNSGDEIDSDAGAIVNIPYGSISIN